tara:strand:+ start:150 stop:425 length:276 start_codon:yes stop_codon:yes gene_type:complete
MDPQWRVSNEVWSDGNRVVQVNSEAFVHHLYMAIETYRESIKTIRNIIETGGDCEGHERTVEQFERQIQECKNVIEACEESDFVEFKKHED